MNSEVRWFFYTAVCRPCCDRRRTVQ